MAHEFEEHLLSAYLDNELSADERALVEQRLKTDPAAQQLLEDLKRVRSLVATLPGWQGGDATFALPDAPHAFNTGETNVEVPPPNTATQVDYSTSLAESRLRKREKLTAGRTRRSMRWTTLVALAAGLTMLMLAAPYFFRPGGPASELAQRTESQAEQTTSLAEQTAPDQTDESTVQLAVPEPASPPADQWDAKKALEEGAEENAPQKTGDVYFRAPQPADTAASKAAAGAAAPQAVAEPMDGTAAATGRGVAPPPAARSRLQQAQAGERDASDALPRSGTATFGNAGASPSSALSPMPVPSLAAEAATAAELESSTPPPMEDARLSKSLAGGGGALPPQSAAPAPMSRAVEAGNAMTEGRLGPADPATTSSPGASQVVAARSDAWTEAEVDAALDRVWYFVDPSAAGGLSARRSLAEHSDWGMGGAFAFAAPAGEAGRAASTNRAYDAQQAGSKAVKDQARPNLSTEKSDADNAALGKVTTDAPAPDSGPKTGSAAAEPSAQGPRAAGRGAIEQAAAIQQAAAIGLARLPSGQTADAVFERLQQAGSLKTLEALPKNESVDRLGEAAAPVESLRGNTALGIEQRKSSDTQTIVLFVSATEARQILESLETAQKEAAQKEAAQMELQSRQEDKAQPPSAGQQERSGALGGALPRTAASENAVAGQLPPGWWTRPQMRFQQRAANAEATGDEKVILILSQLPRG